jgi:hypothetical protein
MVRLNADKLLEALKVYRDGELFFPLIAAVLLRTQDGVVYAEVRFAPQLHTAGGLTEDEVVAAVLRGLERGQRAFGVDWGLIICALRHLDRSLEAAELAIRWRDAGVVGGGANSAARSAAGKPASGTARPRSPSRSASPAPPASSPSAGVPQHIASTKAIPKPSPWDGIT